MGDMLIETVTGDDVEYTRENHETGALEPVPFAPFMDAVKALRTLADEIEAGDLGAVKTVAVVVLGSETVVAGIGPVCHAEATLNALQQGIERLESAMRGSTRF